MAPSAGTRYYCLNSVSLRAFDFRHLLSTQHACCETFGTNNKQRTVELDHPQHMSDSSAKARSTTKAVFAFG